LLVVILLQAALEEVLKFFLSGLILPENELKCCLVILLKIYYKKNQCYRIQK